MGVRVLTILVLALAAAACGPSAAHEARTARYDASPDVLFETALQTADEKYDIAEVDPSARAFRTVEQWYEKDGTFEDKNSDGDYMVGEGSVLLSMLVKVQGEPGAYQVIVEPLGVRHVAGSPQGVPLRSGDISMPGWIQGKIDDLQVAIYERVKATLAASPASAGTP